MRSAAHMRRILTSEKQWHVKTPVLSGNAACCCAGAANKRGILEVLRTLEADTLADAKHCAIASQGNY